MLAGLSAPSPLHRARRGSPRSRCELRAFARLQSRAAPMNARVVGLCALALSAAALVVWRRGADAPPTPDSTRSVAASERDRAVHPASYAGRAACAACHERETKLWTGSHHDLAMQAASDATVLGDFGGAKYDYHGVVSTFSKRDGRFFVETDGADGALHEYEIAYTYGVDPLQQYLVRFDDGRIQALSVCWDTRPKERGGQRWFHLYPHENVAHDDVLHWTGAYQNWNHMCAECHSTNVHKNYDAAKNSFRTTWSEIDVSCEACHGPASEHVAWAEARARGETAAGGDLGAQHGGAKGLVASLREPAAAAWVMDPATGIARRDRPRTSENELEACARCHSRRSQLAEDWLPGRSLADTHHVALLDRELYEDDGQNKDEVYEYGAFLQSKMHAAGVSCSDCHDPHALALPPDNSVCARCHSAERFDTPEHHHHARGSQAARCIECHMPKRDYMVVHTRHDHSFRVPRPDLTESIGTPNACAACHAERPASWAAEAIAGWRKNKASPEVHYGEALHLGNRDLPNAAAALVALSADAKKPPIVRASALALLAEHFGAPSAKALAAGTRDPDPIVRTAAAVALRNVPAEARVALLVPLVNDDVRSVRIEAGRALAGVQASLLSQDAQRAAQHALGEWIAAQMLVSDRAEAHLNLGALDAESGDLDGAEREYKTALALVPRFPATYANLADLHRQRGHDSDAERVLRAGLAIAPNDASLLSALGLTLVRLKRNPEALALLEQAAASAPDDPRHAFVHGIALSSMGQTDRALAVLAAAHARHPGDRDILQALATLSRDAKQMTAAVEYARKLVALDPDDRGARALLAELASSAK
jgi:Flp pilus assembly protein TadD